MSAPPAPTDFNTSLASYYPVQDGYYDANTGLWNEGGGGMILGEAGVPLPNDQYIGLQFQLYDLDPDQGYPLNPPMFPEPRPADPVTGAAVETSPFNLYLSSVPGLNGASGTAIAYVVPEVNPAPFTSASPPFSRGEAAAGAAGAFAYVGPDATRQNFLATGGGGAAGLTFSSFQPYIQHGNFRGRIAISILWLASTTVCYWYSTEGAGGDLTLTAEFSARQTPFHTGMMVGEAEVKRKTRAVHSYKSGFPYLADEAVQDGFTDGIMMHPDDYDPEDPVDQGRGDYVPSPRESVVDDEVTDLEG